MAVAHDERWDGLLEPAYTAAHRALKRLADDDVPASLRRVRAASKGKGWSKPILKTLVTHLEQEWLRDLAVTELGDSPADDPSRIFLTRADGWDEKLDAMCAEQAERRQQREMEKAASERQKLEALNEELTRRLRHSEAQLHDLGSRLESDERLDSLRKRLEETSRSVTRLEAVISQKDDEIERLARDLAEADDRIGVLRTRSARDSEAARRADAGPRAFGRGNPIDTARMLDELVETLRPRPGEVHAPVQQAPLALPPGVRPDSPEAIEWIRSIDRKILLLVDGHNVAHDFSPDPGRLDRDRIVSEVARLKRLADGPISAVVFFDSAHEPERYQTFGVAVRYVPDADAAIDDAAAAADVDCVVISTDREVRARVGTHGALALWGTGFSSWIRRS
ncbi:MAG: hypothetical protein WD532_01845 [Acidimicrobiia bacterium]